MKNVIPRKLPLDVHYTCIDKKYIPLSEGVGYCCDNCGKLIANIATVKSVKGVYHIGFDCLETFLINNHLLDNFDIANYENVKKWISQTLRIAKTLKNTITQNSHLNITGLAFELCNYPTSFYPFYWLQNNDIKSRDNDYIKVKDMNFDFMISTLQNIFPKLTFIVNGQEHNIKK